MADRAEGYLGRDILLSEPGAPFQLVCAGWQGGDLGGGVRVLSGWHLGPVRRRGLLEAGDPLG